MIDLEKHGFLEIKNCDDCYVRDGNMYGRNEAYELIASNMHEPINHRANEEPIGTVREIVEEPDGVGVTIDLTEQGVEFLKSLGHGANVLARPGPLGYQTEAREGVVKSSSEPPDWFSRLWHDFEQTDEFKRTYSNLSAAIRDAVYEEHGVDGAHPMEDFPAFAPSLDNHYADMPVQPTHAAMQNGLDPCQHHLTKYVWRWNRGKHDGTRDLHAARKLLGQYIHYEETGEWCNHEDLPTELR